MRKRILSVLLMAAAIAFVSGEAAAQKNSRNRTKELTKPTAKEAVRTLLDNGSVSLAPYESCKSVIAYTKDNTVFDYLSEILSYEAEPESKAVLDFEITSKKEKNGETLWICSLMFHGKLPPAADGADFSDVWSMGFRFAMRDSDRKMVRTTLECLAAG